MGAAVSCFEPGGACDCSRPPPCVRLDGVAQELPTRAGRNNILVVTVGETSSRRLREHTHQGRQAAIEIEVRVLRGSISPVVISVDVNAHVGARKLVPLPVKPELQHSTYQQQQQQQTVYNNQRGGPVGHHAQHSSPSDDNLGKGGCRLRLLATHTNTFEEGEYYVTCSAIVPGSILVKATSLVEMTPGAGLQPIALIAHQPKLLPLPDFNVTWGDKQQQQVVQQQNQQQQQRQQHLAPMQPRPGYGQVQPQTHPQQQPQQPYGPMQSYNGQTSGAYGYGHTNTNSSGMHGRYGHTSRIDTSYLPVEVQSYIQSLEREVYEQSQEILSLQRQNRSLDERIYGYERGGGRGSSMGVSNDLQLNRYKEYILKAKQVIAQQKDRIMDLETTSMVGRLESHLLEYKEYAARQKQKLAELSEEMEIVDRERRELRDEAEELRARYHIFKRQLPEYRDEPSPRRTAHSSRTRRGVSVGVYAYDSGLPGASGIGGGGYSYPPYSHSNAMSEWERELMAPKTPTAPSRYRDHDRDRQREYEDDRRRGYERERDRDRYAADRLDFDERRDRDRDWDRDREREREGEYKYSARPSSSNKASRGRSPSPSPPRANLRVSGSLKSYRGEGRHRNAQSSRPYNRFGSARDERERAAITIQAAYRGYKARRQRGANTGSKRAKTTNGVSYVRASVTVPPPRARTLAPLRTPNHQSTRRTTTHRHHRTRSGSRSSSRSRSSRGSSKSRSRSRSRSSSRDRSFRR